MPLFGHETAVSAFRDALDGGKLPHAWLVAGTPGIGKATFAEKAALLVLANAAGPPVGAGLDVPAEHPIAALVAAGSHPDLMRLERLPADNAAGIARSITVDQVRGLHRLFDTTSSLSPWRVVIIDSADELEGRGAPNALLKMLEEPPPNSLFLLVSHYPDRLLPTIRSRCRLLRLKPLSDDVMASALRSLAPEAREAEIEAMVRSGAGAPGRALAQRGLDLDSLDAVLGELVREGDPTNARRSALASALALKAAQPRYEAFLARAPARIAAEARGRRGAELAEAITLWERAVALAGAAQRLTLDVPSTVFELAGMLAALAPDRTSARAA